MDAGQFFALLTVLSVVFGIVASTSPWIPHGWDKPLTALYTTGLVVGVLGCVWIASGISLSVSL